MKVKRSHQDEWEEVCHRKKEYVVDTIGKLHLAPDHQ
jgi:hypothetical protein